MLQPTPSPISAPLPTETFFVPVPFAHPHATAQEPGSVTDTPGSTGPQAGPQGGGGPNQQVPDQKAPPGGMCMGDPNMLIFLGVGFALLYFMMIRPENKRRKQQQEMLASIKAGDHVVTLGGMHGVVASVDDKTVTLRCDTAKVVFDRTAIARIDRGDAPAPNKS